jgi:hypothetical protein
VKWDKYTNWQQKWLSWEEIRSGEDLAKAWKSYTETLKDRNVKIGEYEDQSLWSINPSRTYTPKLGYRSLDEKGFVGQLVWWWRIIWKLRCPSKNKIFMSLALNDKAPTWEFL